MQTKYTVGIVRNPGSFLPEADAYLSVLGDNPCLSVTEFTRFDDATRACDVVIAFAGFYPAYRARGRAKVILDYNSLSIGPLRVIRDVVKRAINVQPDLFVALNEVVATRLRLPRDRTLLRPMGVSPRLFDLREQSVRERSAIYAGSVSRSGVVEHILQVADSGLTVHVYGNTPDETVLFKGHSGVRLWGKVKNSEIINHMNKVTYGINFTPDIFPYNVQDSTKILEYCAAGLGVITNRYKWVDIFESDRNAAFMDIKNVNDIKSVSKFNFIIPDIRDLAWPEVIGRSGLAGAIIDLATGDSIRI